MENEKKVITITITDLDNELKVLEALSKLFSTIFTYYLENDKGTQFYNLIMSCGVYFGHVLREAGLTPEDFRQEEPNEQ
jgi:hypothetical protein